MNFVGGEFPHFSLSELIAYPLGVVCAGFALWRSRTTQGATAWVVGLMSFPLVAVPLFLIFGRNRFYGYIRKRKALDQSAQREADEMNCLFALQVPPPAALNSLTGAAERVGQPAFTDGNQVHLLVDGQATYDAMWDAIEGARKYILFQFYIFRADAVGREFAERLKKKARAGVRVLVLYDPIGVGVPRRFAADLRAAGVQVNAFRSTKSWSTRLQINFRNHRKAIVVDGRTAFIGGLNIGEDYLGRGPFSMGAWRDTHLRLDGPAALAVQMSFVKDWYWIEEQVPDLDWVAPEAVGSTRAYVCHSGPSDEIEACLLAHITAINSANQRIWISTPYFVPPESFVHALELSLLRGVEVRILVPSRSDNRWVKLAAEVFVARLVRAGARCYAYLPGFTHQKVMLIDTELTVVGSANLDSRSMFLNFELSAFVVDASLADAIRLMLERDFAAGHELSVEEVDGRSFPRRLLTRAVSLLSPML